MLSWVVTIYINYKQTMKQITSGLKYGNVHWSELFMMTSEKFQGYIFNTHAHLGGVQGIRMSNEDTLKIRKWRNFLWERWKWK